MSSVLLYLAIVVMWLCVLIPMWLRRDKTNLAELAELEEYYTGEHQLPDLDNLAPPPETDEDDGTPPVEVEKVDVRLFRLRRRAIIVARRRRLLFFTALLVLASIVTASVKMIPWWGWRRPSSSRWRTWPFSASPYKWTANAANAAARRALSACGGNVSSAGPRRRRRPRSSISRHTTGTSCSTSTPSRPGGQWATESVARGPSEVC
ncbi:hypothetical protein ACFQYP_59045 [Nonomuraea antimicrobica]